MNLFGKTAEIGNGSLVSGMGAGLLLFGMGCALGWALCRWRARRQIGRLRGVLQAEFGAGPALSALAGRTAPLRSSLRALRDVRPADLADFEARADELVCGFAELDADGVVVTCNLPLLRLAGLDSADGRRSTVEAIFKDDAEMVRGLLASAEVELGIPRAEECSLTDAEGRAAHCVVAGRRIAGGRSTLVVVETGGLHRVEEHLHRMNVQLWLMNELTAIALRVRELEPAIDQMARALRESASFRAAGIAVLEPHGNRVRCSCLAGFGDVTRGQARTFASSFLAAIHGHDEPILMSAPAGRFEFDGTQLGAVEAKVFGAFPLIVDERVIGLLMLAATDLGPSPEDFGHRASDLARHLAPLLQQKLTNEQLRTSNTELEDARVAAEDANRAKSDFLANMSHEIRTPMTAILGYADLVSEAEDDVAAGETGEFVDTIRRNGEHLLSIINDILDISKVESGAITIEQVSCSPALIARDILETWRGRAEQKGVPLELEVHWPLPGAIVSDPTRLRQIVSNLVGNALKFTESGRVTLRLRAMSGDGQAELEFAVEDTGIGLSAAELTRIFRPFVQADSSHTRRFGGTGLGLTISQRFAGLLGGSLQVQSCKGKGSTFSLRLGVGSSVGPEVSGWQELDRAGQVSGNEQRGEPGQRARVLLAEDGRDNQRLISLLLRRAGHDVAVVEDGRSAVRATLEAELADEPFDVVLMDMQMPKLDGYGATSELREAGYRGAVLALTAHAMAGDRDRCLSAGCDEYLTKPINRAELLEGVRRALVDRPAGGSGESA